MHKILASFFFFFATNSFAAPAHYTVHCSVADKQPATKVLADGDFEVYSNKDVTVANVPPYEMIVGVSEVRPQTGEAMPIIFLTIKKHGKVVAQSMSDFDAKKPGNVNLWKNLNSPLISCRPHAK